MAGLLCGVVCKSIKEIRGPVMAACSAIMRAAQAAITFSFASFPTCYGSEYRGAKNRSYERHLNINALITVGAESGH